MTDNYDAAAQSADEAYEEFGLAAVFTFENGTKKDVLAILQFDTSEYGEVVRVAAQSVRVSVRTSQLPVIPKVNETFYIEKLCRTLTVYYPGQGTEYEHEVLAS